MNSSNEQIASATSIPAPSWTQNLKQISTQDELNDPTSEEPPEGVELIPSDEQGANPNQPNTQSNQPNTQSNQPNTQSNQPNTQSTKIEKYKVNVKFDSITVHNDHEGKFSGDGEYVLSAYVHGIKVDLTKLSQWRDSGLGDVSSGETVTFPAGNFIGVNIDNTLPLTIVTAGIEDDGCGKPLLPDNIQKVVYSAVANETAKTLGVENGTQGVTTAGSGNKGPSTVKGAGAAAGAAAGQYYGGEAGAMAGQIVGDKVGGYVESGLDSIKCKINSNDKIGMIDEGYNPPNYGAGPHEVKSDAGDFTLRYTISAQRVS